MTYGNDLEAMSATLQSLSNEALPALLIGASETPRPATTISRIDGDKAPWLLLLRASEQYAVAL